VAFDSLDALEWLRKHLEQDSPDLLREMVKSFAEQLMAAEADAVCGASYGERSPERVNSRNGYRHRDFDTRAGTMDLAVPKLRQGSYFPGWLLEPRRRAERALTQVVCQCYVEGVSTRRVDDIVKAMGIEGISKMACGPTVVNKYQQPTRAKRGRSNHVYRRRLRCAQTPDHLRLR
jgi:putative transposase